MSDITRDWSFGGQIKSLRIKRKFTLREFCRQNGFDCGNYSKIEMSRMAPPNTLDKIIELTKPLKPSKVELEMIQIAAYSFHQGRLFQKFYTGSGACGEEVSDKSKIFHEGDCIS